MKQSEKRKTARQREEQFKPTASDQAWSMDFVADQLQDGVRFRSLTIVDMYTREAVGIEVGQSLKEDDVERTLNRLKLDSGIPKMLFCDNGSVFTSQAVDLWAYRNGMEDRLLQARQAYWQCFRRKLQWNLPSRVSGHPLVR